MSYRWTLAVVLSVSAIINIMSGLSKADEGKHASARYAFWVSGFMVGMAAGCAYIALMGYE